MSRLPWAQTLVSLLFFCRLHWFSVCLMACLHCVRRMYPTGWNSDDGRDSALEYRLSILHASQDDSGEFTCTTPTRHTHAVTIEVKGMHRTTTRARHLTSN